MRFISTFFLGLLIAFSSLIAQVFLTVIADLFFNIDINFQYTQQDSFQYVTLTMLLAATIEEILRYFALKKNTIIHIQKKITDTIFLGILFGIGFTTFEVILISFNQSLTQITTLLPMIISVLLIHICISIFFLLFIKHKSSISSELYLLLIAIFAHTLANILLFNFFM
jgi:RsiW-degrading membrane proteinase PrsW (M82 family)